MSGKEREGLRDARRLVVKIGSASLTADGGRFERLARQVAARREEGRTVVVVSSGAIALGMKRLGMGQRPRTMAKLQAAAAAGQSQLMQAWEDAFRPYGAPAAQVLLTHEDLRERDRYLNARAAIDALLELGAVPIINENDTVAVDEIRFGDNDQLAAMVATLVGADLLVLLTGTDGILEGDGKRIGVVADVASLAAHVRPGAGELGSGGMPSKVDAARRATHRGVPVVIARADEDEVLARLLAGEEIGTLFLPQGARLASRKHWIAFTLKPEGAIIVDSGAVQAVSTGKRSLLPAGVVGVRGDFEPGDAVLIVGPDGKEVARGLARYATKDVARLCGAKTAEIEERLGRHAGDEIVHRDDLVVTGS